MSRAELRAAVAHLLEVAPPADADPDGEWRTTLVERFASVRAFVSVLCEAIEFGATAQAAGILTAMAHLPALLDARATTAVPAGYLDARRIADDVVPPGWWRRTTLGGARRRYATPTHPTTTADERDRLDSATGNSPLPAGAARPRPPDKRTARPFRSRVRGPPRSPERRVHDAGAGSRSAVASGALPPPRAYDDGH